MSHQEHQSQGQPNYSEERSDLAAAFRWTARLGLNEGVANHFSLALTNDGRKFLINPNQFHFERISASDLVFVDLDHSEVTQSSLDPTAWSLHSAIHQACPRARCVMHLHPIYSTVLASLQDSELKPIDQNTATFFRRHIVDSKFNGLALNKESVRCAEFINGTNADTVVMANHGILVIGRSVADAFNRVYYFERAAETYIKALTTGQSLRVMSDEVAELTARQMDNYPNQAERHLQEIKAILDAEKSNYWR